MQLPRVGWCYGTKKVLSFVFVLQPFSNSTTGAMLPTVVCRDPVFSSHGHGCRAWEPWQAGHACVQKSVQGTQPTSWAGVCLLVEWLPILSPPFFWAMRLMPVMHSLVACSSNKEHSIPC